MSLLIFFFLLLNLNIVYLPKKPLKCSNNYLTNTLDMSVSNVVFSINQMHFDEGITLKSIEEASDPRFMCDLLR